MKSQRKKTRVLTLTLPDQDQPRLILHGKAHLLRNFSDEGIGVWVQPPLSKDLSVEKPITAQLSLQGKMYDIELRVKHGSGRFFGLKIESDNESLKNSIKALLEPTRYAESLLPKKCGKEDPEVGYPRLYFSGSSGAELTVWYHAAHHYIVGLQACFLGKWIYRVLNQEKKIGFLKDGFQGSEGLRVLDTDLLHVDPKELSKISHEASQFLSSVPMPLPGHLLWQFFETGESVFLPSSLFQELKVA